MALKFTKMHGLGNDFVVVDGTKESADLVFNAVQKLADRKTGIGFDQLLLIQPSPSKEYDFIYRIFNADGKEVEQCGNGARCVGAYIFTEGLSRKDKIVLGTVAGCIEIFKQSGNQITVNMGTPKFMPEAIPFITEKQALEYQLVVDETPLKFGAVSMGNPHIVVPVNNVASAPLKQIGEQLQHHSSFPKQVNVGFMEVVSPDYLRLRVFERGVGETNACGSGACAAFAIGRLWQQLAPEVTVELPGGRLKIRSSENNILMTGPAEKVFRGELV
jgi:diaminopimelate epimerase